MHFLKVNNILNQEKTINKRHKKRVFIDLKFGFYKQVRVTTR